MNYNASFIRLEVVELILSQSPIFNKTITEKIFSDKHPDIVNQAIRYCFANWKKYNQYDKTYLSKLIIEAAYRQEVAIRMFNFVATFGKDYTSAKVEGWNDFNRKEKSELWKLWSIVFPIVLKGSRFDPYLHGGRFTVTMDDAVEFIHGRDYLNVLEIWYNRIDFRLRAGYTVSENELCIADNLIKFSENAPHLRLDLFKKILSDPHTGFIIYSLGWFLFYWEKLTNEEKEIIYALIESDREDIRWIKAVCLTTESPIPEIVEKITGRKDIFEISTTEFFEVLPQQLTEDCLVIYYG